MTAAPPAQRWRRPALWARGRCSVEYRAGDTRTRTALALVPALSDLSDRFVLSLSVPRRRTSLGPPGWCRCMVGQEESGDKGDHDGPHRPPERVAEGQGDRVGHGRRQLGRGTDDAGAAPELRGGGTQVGDDLPLEHDGEEGGSH